MHMPITIVPMLNVDVTLGKIVFINNRSAIEAIGVRKPTVIMRANATTTDTITASLISPNSAVE
ncbi:hypothetical protein D3C87_1879710 [compost metagenome]